MFCFVFVSEFCFLKFSQVFIQCCEITNILFLQNLVGKHLVLHVFCMFYFAALTMMRKRQVTIHKLFICNNLCDVLYGVLHTASALYLWMVCSFSWGLWGFNTTHILYRWIYGVRQNYVSPKDNLKGNDNQWTGVYCHGAVASVFWYTCLCVICLSTLILALQFQQLTELTAMVCWTENPTKSTDTRVTSVSGVEIVTMVIRHTRRVGTSWCQKEITK